MESTLLSRFLTALGVPHTRRYSDAQFRTMTFSSLFGLSHVLAQYGVATEGLSVADHTELSSIATPFLAQLSDGVVVIVEDIAGDSVTYDRLGQITTAPLAKFESDWNGIVLLAFPDAHSAEPSLASHRWSDFVARASVYVLVAALGLVFAYFSITRGVWSHVSTSLAAVLDLAGIFFCTLLVQKTLGFKSKTADHVCGVIEKGGCDSVLASSASKLFGVFSWSEVGYAYFGVSLATLLLFPHLWGALALFNACCLPYTLWSVWYQRFRAGNWCTLCLGVQSTLWLTFFCWLGGGWYRHVLPLEWDYAVLLAAYVGAVMLLNLTDRFIHRLTHES